MKSILGACALTAAITLSGAAFAQGANVTGVGDAAARNQLSTVGVGRGTGSGGPGYSYGIPGAFYGTPLYSGRSAYEPVSPYGYAGYGYSAPYLPE